MLVSLLGIGKAGGAYLALDPSYPAERLEYMLADSGVEMVLTDGVNKRIGGAQLAWIGVGDVLSSLEVDAVEREGAPAKASHLAYVLYTSGSTGRPKGVLIGHGSLLNFLWSMKERLEVNEGLSMLAITSYSFDIAYLELYLPLLVGGKVILLDRVRSGDGGLLRKELGACRPSHVQATPSTWQMLLDSGWSNAEKIQVLTGGEAIGEGMKNRLTGLSEEKVWNMYGPTETTIWSSMGELRKGEGVTIGGPIANRRSISWMGRDS